MVDVLNKAFQCHARHCHEGLDPAHVYTETLLVGGSI